MKSGDPQPEVRWDRMTAPALRKLARQKTVVIIPIGATEQYEPHLPVQVDWRLAYEVSLRAARLMDGRQRAIVTPAIPFGMSEHHMSLGGTLTLNFSAMAAASDASCVRRRATASSASSCSTAMAAISPPWKPSSPS